MEFEEISEEYRENLMRLSELRERVLSISF